MVGAFLGINGLQTHSAQQALDPFVVHVVALATQLGCHLGPAVERCLGVLLIDQAHEM